jgi:hypothetical protein
MKRTLSKVFCQETKDLEIVPNWKIPKGLMCDLEEEKE